jgi:hypothetical protein
MAYWAKVLNGKVLNISVGATAPTDNTVGAWVEYYKPCNNTQAQKYNQAFVGGNYEKGDNAFYDPQPYPSWTLDANFKWQAPLSMPADSDSVDYIWDEDAYQSDNTTGWSVKS